MARLMGFPADAAVAGTLAKYSLPFLDFLSFLLNQLKLNDNSKCDISNYACHREERLRRYVTIYVFRYSSA